MNFQSSVLHIITMIPHPQLLLVLLALSGLTHGQKLKDIIYTDIEEIRPCFRRLNGAAEIGCKSSIGGNVGVVLYIKQMLGRCLMIPLLPTLCW